MADFPVHPDEVTPSWLSEVLGASVAALRWESIGTGQVGDSVRFQLEGENVPATLAGKFPAADETSRATAAMFGLYRKEVEFYRQAAPLLKVRAPKTYFAQGSDDGTQFCLIFEDLGPARQGDQIAGCTIEDARAAMKQAAAIHAPSWGRADIIEAPWLQPAANQGDTVAAMYPKAQVVFRERYGELLEPEYMSVCEALAELAAPYFRRDPELQCLVHGDFRLDNMLFDIRGGAEPIAVLDWQTAAVGKPSHDIAYFIGTGIGQLGLDHEDELLELYLAEMGRLGVGLTREGIRESYRLGILHGVSTAVFSAAFVERTERGDANFLSMARGGCALALRHDSIGALREKD
ncbi:phosphotransferase [Qipengyuania sphaerica]|uniref:phosphotransferase n=1 Tax=Qipengyuania sphaerica TaxID=2867243 RepID=UPI001C869B60|nr:phosphotransferase [Qipengyuania sphaerica]MBX7540771.1 ecdysteroid 22-kinase family protein [Qipengyuania sphaerica]